MDLHTQKELRLLQSLPFCCICGKQFAHRDERDRQHVPPKAIFATADRSPPLILPAHPKCNTGESPIDTQMGQLIAVLHGKQPPEDGNLKLKARAVPGTGVEPVVMLDDPGLGEAIFRWASYFHAALYREFLTERNWRVFDPFPNGDMIGGRAAFEMIPEERRRFTHAFKQQLKAGRTDSITCYNGKCRYHCTWITPDPKRRDETFCVFALRLYNWEELGDQTFGRMGCVGFYRSPIPPNGMLATPIDVAVANLEPLDPFGP